MSQILGNRNYYSNQNANRYLRTRPRVASRSNSRYSWAPKVSKPAAPRMVNTGGSGGSSGYSYTPSEAFSFEYPEWDFSGLEYELPAIDLEVPNLNWAPTEEQKADYLTRGKTRAGIVVDPQVAAQENALARYRTEVDTQRDTINPQYTNTSLALANVIKNQMYQPGVENLIRRGAADSGALDQLQQQTGRYETEQRGMVEQERNTILNALAKQMLAKEEEVSGAKTELEKLRGQYTDVYSQEAEKDAWNQFLTTKQSTFQNELSKAELQNAMAAAAVQARYQSALLEQQARQSAFENALAEKQFGLQQAYQNYQMRPQNNSINVPTQSAMVNTPYGSIPFSVAVQLGYAPYGQYYKEEDEFPW